MADIFTLNIRTDTFEADRHEQVAIILRHIAAELDSGVSFDFYRTLFDPNGNDVGRAAFKSEEYLLNSRIKGSLYNNR